MADLNTLTLKESLEGLRAKKFTSVELVSACLLQIKKYDNEIQAFTTISEEHALKKAQEADLEIQKYGDIIFESKPLLGIPYACKDNFCTKGIKTTASSNVLKDFYPPYESTVTSRLNNAGAILIGKTNMDAFAHGSSTETSDFFTTKNPWDLARLPGGSSGGSSAAVAANMCIFAIGSETAGSIRGPASWCGVTGLKPTYGRVSRYGVIAMASSTDSPGPITKTVYDASLILNNIAGKDLNDATSSPNAIDLYSDLKLNDLSNINIGLPKSYFEAEMEEGVRSTVLKAIDDMVGLGASITEIDLLDPKYSIAIYTILQRAEVSSNLARFDGIRYGNDRSSFGFEAKKRMLLGAYVLSVGYYDEYYAKAQKARTLLINDFDLAFDKVDVIVGPTMPNIAMKTGEAESSSSMFGELIDMFQEPSAIAGLAAISIPCGFSDNMPVGVQFIAPQFSEQKMLNIANAYQKNSVHHKTLPSLGLGKTEN